MLHVMNEYMAVDDANGERLAGLSRCHHHARMRNGVPVSVGELREGDELSVLRIAKNQDPAVVQRHRSVGLSGGREGAGHFLTQLRAELKQAAFDEA